MSSLADYLDKGASLGRDAPCLVEGERTLSYGHVQDLSWSVAGALARSGVAPGGKVGILSSNHAVAFACVFGIARRGACGARSTRATRWPRTARCSRCSTASA